jgi:hypothetical protein
MGEMEKWKNGDTPLTPERRLMNEALARIGQSETQGAARRSGRLVFILDLTGSRKASLRQAHVATAEMFAAVKRIGSVAVRLIYYRGDHECKASEWQSDPEIISRAMQLLSVETGETQIARSLRLVLEREKEPVSGVVFIGDQCEDDPEELAHLAAALGEKHIPVFVFHEVQDWNQGALEAKPIFKLMAEASNGVYLEFESGSSGQLGELLSSVAAFITAGEGVKQVGQAVTPQARELQSRLLLLGPAPEKG